MPIYEYTCHGCGGDVEIWQKISEKPKRVCPTCGARRLERVISQTSFHLKGSGWYVTDYAKKGASAPSAPKKDKPSEPAPSKSSDSSSDSSSD